MPRVYEQRPFCCRECGETDPENFFWVMRRGKKVPTQKSLCKVHVRAYNNANHAKRKHEVAARVLLKKFGVSQEEYDAQLELQQGKCPCCGRTREEDIENRGRRWPVDHDHETDDVRGILCWLCNLALGAVRDEPDTLRRLADYVEQGGVWDAP